MPRWVILKCIGKSVLFHGGKGLLNWLGGKGLGDMLFDALPEIAREAYDCISKSKDPAAQVKEIESLAQAPFAKVRQEAARVAEEVAADQPPSERDALAAYLV